MFLSFFLYLPGFGMFAQKVFDRLLNSGSQTLSMFLAKEINACGQYWVTGLWTQLQYFVCSFWGTEFLLA